MGEIQSVDWWANTLKAHPASTNKEVLRNATEGKGFYLVTKASPTKSFIPFEKAFIPVAKCIPGRFIQRSNLISSLLCLRGGEAEVKRNRTDHRRLTKIST